MQETLLAAWRGLEAFEGRSSVRSWLYRIATNRSLNAVRDRGRRPPEAPPPPEPSPPPPQPTGQPEPVWLQPYPDVLLEGAIEHASDPEARYEARESVGLAFMVALQRLPPRQRAALVLRDVLGFRAAEAAEILETTEVVSQPCASPRAASDRGDSCPIANRRHCQDRARSSSSCRASPRPSNPATSPASSRC